MKNRKRIQLWRLVLIVVMVCIGSVPQFSGAAPLAQIPTGPLDAYNGTPDYYTTANWANSPPLAKFVDTLPGLGSSKANNLGQYLTVGKPDITTYPGSDYYEIELREFRQRMHSDLPATTGPTTGSTTGTLLRGYVQVNRGTNLSTGTLPSQNKCGADQHACTAADTASGTGTAPDPIHYMGPTFVSERDRPVRIKFTNRLPVGSAGDLFVPTDLSVMGAGTGPASPVASRGAVAGVCNNTVEPNSCASYTQNRATIHVHGGRTPWISDGTPHQWITPAEEITPFTKGVSAQNVPDMPDPGDGSMTFYYTNQQSARLMFYHDHSFGITRLNVYVGEVAGYLITDQYEQDLISRGIIPPDQIPLIIQDKTFVDATPVPHPVSGTITPKIRVTDPLWNWGSGQLNGGVRPPVTGDLWLPHVYMPAQTSTAGIGGVNPFGRWMYGPWFYPATDVTKGPVANPYYDPDCSSSNPLIYANCQTPGQPLQIPGTPNVSMGMEAFQDSAVVNGAVFPSLTVDPRTYRFRILNGASDRFWNLSFYEADPAQISPDTRPASRLTEVKMLPASAHLAATNNWPALWPVDGRDGGVPDPAFKGPSFLQIGTEGGFLPQPVVIEPQPITYNTDPTAFWVGNVDKMALALGPAERADVLVDFSAYAGKTLILYNDAPAAWPARVGGYDYYTDAPDMRDSGGYGTGGVFNKITGAWEDGNGPLVGYAPNTRTIMQVIVRSSVGIDPAYNFSKTNLEKEFTTVAPVTTLNPTGKTLFERAQEPIIVGQAAYKNAYPNSYFPLNFPWEGVSQINDQKLKFVTLAGEEVNAPMHPKGIHDEMGASFDPVYGRMSGNLAMQLPNPTTLNALLVLYGFSDIPTETINNSTQINVSVLATGATKNDPFLYDPLNANLRFTTNLDDGTQIWKISHNGVDTHPIHFHIFDVQLVNRVGWDGQILLPEPNELGWKDTVKISPLEDTIVAVRPRAPALPFGITNSLRPLNPALPIDSAMGFNGVPSTGSDWPEFNSVDWKTGLTYVGTPSYPYANYKGVVTNVLYNFGWEYVWHCHILSHEEMDMMRPIVLNVISDVPAAPIVSSISAGGVITWIDPTPVNYTVYSTFGNPANEIGFNVYRSLDGTFPNDPQTGKPIPLNPTTIPANSTSFTDPSPVAGAVYKVEAFNAKGSTYSPTARPLTVNVAVTNGPTFTAPATISLEATITSLPVGVTVTQVAFYNGTTLIGAAANATPPYTFSWVNVQKGNYNITAVVTDSLGGVAASATLNIVVNGAITANFTYAGSANNGTDIGFCETVDFTSTSTGAITGYSWLINGNNYNSSTVNNITLPTGSYTVTLGVVNSATGEVDQITKNVTIINHNPTAAHGGPYTVTNGGNLTLNGSGTDLDTCSVTPLSYAWNIDNKGSNDYFTANPIISYNVLNTVLGGGTHTVTFQVTDSDGGITKVTTTLTVAVAAPASITVPAISTTGSYQLSWASSATSGVTYTLQESTDQTFASGVSETVNAVSPVTISGKVNGTSYYRVKAVAADTSSSSWTNAANGCTTTLTVITSPVSGVFLPQGTPTAIIATTAAIGPAGSTVTKVEFFENGVLVGTDLTAPYTASWTPATLGARNLTALTYYNDSAISTSSSTSVTVSVLPVLPTITLDTPTNGAAFAMGAAITMQATPSAVSGGTLSQVDFYDGFTLVKSLFTTPPYSFQYIPPATGVRNLTAKASYSNGAIATSATAVVTIASASMVINNGAVITNSQSVNLAISATGADKMSFSNDGNNYTVLEDFATAKAWFLSPGVGIKTVYVKLYNTANNVAYELISDQITLDVIAPVTTAVPAPATFISNVVVNLTADKANSTIRYTTDGSDPTISNTTVIYNGPISLNTTTSVSYFATDSAGNSETPKTGLYTISTSVIAATVTINGGAVNTNTPNVNLSIAATGVDKMSFSNNGSNYSVQENYATSKAWALSAGDGIKTVYVKFHDTINNISYDPTVAQVILDTAAPVTAASPAPGTFITPVNLTLSADEPGSTIKFTLDGSDPVASATAAVYTTPINIVATTTVKYFATDAAGNTELAKSGTYTIHSADLAVQTFTINSGAATTTATNVILTISASDGTGVDFMRFSNDGINYSPDEPYATTKNWTVANGDGVKTVFVRFTDGAGILYDPATAQIVFDSTTPITSALPAPATFISNVTVNLTANESNSMIKYTTDGSDPTTSSTAVIYNGPINLNTTTSVRYFSTDAAGNAEIPKTGLYTIATSVIAATMTINGGAVNTNTPNINLSIAATGVDKMSFSNNGSIYSVQENYSTSKAWALSPGDGIKTVYVKFHDSANNISYDPNIAQITLDTAAPVTAASPASGTFITPVNLALSANEPGSAIKFTIDGSDPVTSATAAVYTTPINIVATATVKYFARDISGNPEAVKTGIYIIHTGDLMVNTFTINSGMATTTSPNVTLAINATDGTGVYFMRFSNDGINYSTDEPYTTGNKNWTLSTGDGVKTVFARFTDGAGLLYDPVTAQIIFDTTKPVTSAMPAPATFIANVTVNLTANEPNSTIKYTTDGSDPTISGTAVIYNGSISLNTTTSVRYFSTDAAGNTETPKTGLYTIASSVIAATVAINDGAIYTNNPNVNLSLAATGVDKMSFSNNGSTYSVQENYATSKVWALSAGDGIKTVYVKFHDTSNNISYDPAVVQITLDTVSPATSITPASGVFISAFDVALAANESGSVIKYTLDGSDPATSVTAATYSTPLTISATATVKYFATDAAGNAEAVKSSSYTIHTGDLVVNTFTVNAGVAATNSTSVTLHIAATDEFGISKMRFSNDGVSYTADEPYATSKNWSLSSGDGVKTVYMRLTDGAGILYAPVTTQIRLDTLAAITAASPPAGTVSMTPFSVALTADDGSGSGTVSIFYTTDGSDPLLSATALMYTTPIPVGINTKPTIRYFATDLAGNKEAVQSSTFEVTHAVNDMNATVTINTGETVTINQAVTLHLSAVDATSGVAAAMQFSNDGISYSSYEPFSTTKAWALTSGEGQKTVHVNFKEPGDPGKVYGPYTAQIAFAIKNGLLPNTTGQLASALKSLQIAKGHITATPADLAHADVAPYSNGAPNPDGKIDLGDVYVLLLNLVGLLGL